MQILMISVFFTLMLSSLHAAVIEDERGKVDIQLKSDWKYEKNILGLPHVFLSSEKPDRTSLSITPTGLTTGKLNARELKKNVNQYRDGRSKWAQERKITIERFLDHNSFLTASGHTIHEIGFDYSLNTKKYSERTYYLECPKSLVHLKLLGPKGSVKVKEVESNMKSVRCL